MLEKPTEDRVVLSESIGEEEPIAQEDRDEPKNEEGTTELNPIHPGTIGSPPQNE